MLNRDSPPRPTRKTPAAKQHTKQRQLSPHQFARHGAHTEPPRIYHDPGGIPRTSEAQMRRGIDIPHRTIR